MKRAQRKEVMRTGAYDIHIIGAPAPGLRDAYHALLRTPWWGILLVITGSFLALNALFALLFWWSGGIVNARPGSFTDAFNFSVQTMGTIGYGAMYPTSAAANALVVAESVTGLVLTALATGLVFVRFSQTRARLMFSKKAAIGAMDGVPTLMMRIGNERRGSIVGTEFRLTFTRTVRTAEGVTIYKLEELPLIRARAPALSRAWNVMHKIVDGSPLGGYDAARLAEVEGELQLEVVGVDDTSLQPVHARHVWFAVDIAWSARLADILSDTPDGNMLLDLSKFHDVVPASTTES
jgi:inward rectifier potassium channel